MNEAFPKHALNAGDAGNHFLLYMYL